MIELHYFKELDPYKGFTGKVGINVTKPSSTSSTKYIWQYPTTASNIPTPVIIQDQENNPYFKDVYFGYLSVATNNSLLQGLELRLYSTKDTCVLDNIDGFEIGIEFTKPIIITMSVNSRTVKAASSITKGLPLWKSTSVDETVTMVKEYTWTNSLSAVSGNLANLSGSGTFTLTISDGGFHAGA